MNRRREAAMIILLIGLVEFLACAPRKALGCKIVSALGGEEAYMVVGILVYTIISGTLGVRLVSALALGASVDVLLKVFINLPRPPREIWLVNASGPGFPSGHALMSAIFWGIVAFEAWSILSLIGGVLSVLAVSESRLILHVHYPRDVVGGAVIGAALILVYLGLRKRYSTLNAAIAMAAAATPLALLALARSPSYDSAQHVAGICLGLAAGLAILYTRRGKQSLVERLSLLQALVALIWAGAGLTAALTLHKGAASVLGFAIFAFLTAISRPLAILVTERRRRTIAPNL